MRLHATKVLYIFIVFTIFSCQKEKTNKYYPTYSIENTKRYSIGNKFELDDKLSENYKELLYSENDSIPFFIIEDDSTKNYVQLDIYKNGHYDKYKNGLRIVNDTIWFEKAYSIDKLDSLLPLHYYNNGKLFSSSTMPKKAFVSLTVDTSATIADLKEYYARILTSYKKTVEIKKDSTQLSIKWIWLNFMPPPPKPLE
jgi:hypothetical protein